jgi:uncharacterized protein (UPF0335 family)
MNARLDKLEVEVAAPESAIEVRLKHIESDVAEIKTDLRSNGSEIKAVRDNVAQLPVQLEARARERSIERIQAWMLRFVVVLALTSLGLTVQAIVAALRQ